MKKIKNLLNTFLSKIFNKKEEKKKTIPETVLFSGKPLEEDFYSTVKLKTGEEIFAKVMASKDENKTMLLLNSPITVTELKNRRGLNGYKIEPWLKTTKNTLLIIDTNDVLALSENNDIEMISMYEQFNQFGDNEPTKKTASRKMGYLSNVNDAKKSLEKIFNNS
jgi:hypothetical protein